MCVIAENLQDLWIHHSILRFLYQGFQNGVHHEVPGAATVYVSSITEGVTEVGRIRDVHSKNFFIGQLFHGVGHLVNVPVQAFV